MNSIKFNCPYCQQDLEVPAGIIGVVVKCPTCGKDIVVPPVRVTGKDIMLSILSFVVTVVFAIILKWQTRDLIWALWICSLSIGYSYFIVSIVAGIVHTAKGNRSRHFGSAAVLLMLFTFHFCGFHLIHGSVLKELFPLMSDKGEPLGLFATIAVAFKSYWGLILTSFIFHVRYFPFWGLEFDNDRTNIFMIKPYVNVVRMHLFIILVGTLVAFRLERPTIYPLLVLYFFPWRIFLPALAKAFSQKNIPAQPTDSGDGT